MSNFQSNKLKSGMKNGTEVTLKLSNDENNFPHKVFLTNSQLSRLHESFANNSFANT